ncbi:uncharacterized protein LOC126900971 isoform X2 [Daktulosphaira vitifoliae]|uniref:uncharacterized protein LOC126900971 isoform X2 n=1 Tax=Daktulosphaira vitifoliae TaxID=58002 RepID=UPI0021A98A7E|nr:uncharacterized protein LOC126900971 isoform X2 [Daktulosphaira vitifoliae]
MLLNTISTILCPLVKLMKGALDYMDTLHVEPWIKGSKKNYTMNKMLSSLSDESFLNFLSPSVIHSSTIENKLITIKKFFYIRRKELNIDMNFCHFKDPIDFISDIQILNNEYENLKTKENEKFYHFLRIKIENEAQWTIKNRYIDLGFQYKINTYETFIPSLQEQKKPKTNIILSEDLSKTLPHDNTEKDRFQNHCESLLNSENKNVNAINCTTELLDTISSSLIPLVKLMKGALESIDKIHTIPRSNHIKNDFILNKVITSLQHNTFLNFLTSTRVNSLNTSNILITLKHFFSKRHPELNVNKEICYPIKNLKFSSFGQHTNHQYNILKNKGFRGTEMEVYHFLRNRIKLIVQWAIKKRYDGLGFQCNLDTHETIFPSLSEQSKRKINKIPSEDLSESLLHDNIEEEMNKIPPKDLPESLLHDNIEEEEENLEDILLEIPNEFLPINMYL